MCMNTDAETKMKKRRKTVKGLRMKSTERINMLLSECPKPEKASEPFKLEIIALKFQQSSTRNSTNSTFRGGEKKNVEVYRFLTQLTVCLSHKKWQTRAITAELEPAL